MKVQTLLKLLALTVACLTISLTADGQISSNAPLSGVVHDPNSAVVPGAIVTVKSNATGAEFNATTASNGTFSIPSLTPGTYTVMVKATGFKQAIVTEVKIDAGTPASVTVTLEVGQTTETVTVQGGGDVVQTQSAAVSTRSSVARLTSCRCPGVMPPTWLCCCRARILRPPCAAPPFSDCRPMRSTS